MSKPNIILTLLLLLLLSMTLNSNFSSCINALATQEVYPGGSIQQAINNAQPGDEIFVHAGIYFETLIVDKPIRLIGEETQTTIIDGNRTGNVIFIMANNVAVSGFTVQNSNNTAGSSYAGVRVSGFNCNISNNYITRNKIGIFVVSQDSRILMNTLTNNGQGLALYDSSGVIVEANQFSGNTVGISLALSSENIVRNNDVANSSAGGHGITLSSNSYNNTIFTNDLKGNYHGMWLSASSDNWIIGNVIADNELLGVELADSFNNTFYHNNFINNPKHIVLDESVSIWDNDYPSGGNFWSDYAGVDIDGDGFGDTPYIINAVNRDNYPLITPALWHNDVIPIVWEGVIYPIVFLSNSSISEFHFNQSGMRISFNVSGPLATTGFCNITIPKDLLSANPWIVTVDSNPPTTFIPTSNFSHSFLYFTYNHTNSSLTTMQGTSVVSEFAPALFLILSIVAALLILVHRNKDVSCL